MKKILVGISACLLGHKVRYNGDGLRPGLINDTFARYFEYVAVCPEVDIGMGVPREIIRLEKRGKAIRMRAPKSGRDYTEEMTSYAQSKVSDLKNLRLSGYILKKDSPTCGMERVKIWDKNGVPDKRGQGLFAQVLMQKIPWLPVEEEGRLNDIGLREHFITRVFALNRLQNFLNDRPTMGKLIRFHTAHKLLLMAHHPAEYRQLGHRLANVPKDSFEEFLPIYADAFMRIMQTAVSLKKQTDVLYHVMGYFKDNLKSTEKREFIALIEQYKTRKIPIIVPITMLRHYLSKYPKEWLLKQVFFDPFPEELLLRSYL